MSEKEMERKNEPSKESSPMVKRPYVAPQLHEYGHLADLTKGGSGDGTEVGFPSATTT